MTIGKLAPRLALLTLIVGAGPAAAQQQGDPRVMERLPAARAQVISNCTNQFGAMFGAKTNAFCTCMGDSFLASAKADPSLTSDKARFQAAVQQRATQVCTPILMGAGGAR